MVPLFLLCCLSAPAYELLRPGRVAVSAPSPQRLDVRFVALNRSFALRLFRQTVFAERAEITILEGGRARTLPTDAIRTFSGSVDGGGWAHATWDGGLLHAAMYTRDGDTLAARVLFRLAPLSSLRGHAQLVTGNNENSGNRAFNSNRGNRAFNSASDAQTMVFFKGPLPTPLGSPPTSSCGARSHAHTHDEQAHSHARGSWLHRAGMDHMDPEMDPMDPNIDPMQKSLFGQWPSYARVKGGKLDGTPGLKRGRALQQESSDGGTVEERDGRMCHCPLQPTILKMEVGLILDAGFVNATGGTDRAVAEVAHMLQLVNALYTEQLGVFVSAKKMIVNTDLKSDFASSGPNNSPVANDGQTGACASPVAPGRNTMRATTSGGGEVDVKVDGAAALLSQFATWAQQHGQRAAAGDGRPRSFFFSFFWLLF